MNTGLWFWSVALLLVFNINSLLNIMLCLQWVGGTEEN